LVKLAGYLGIQDGNGRPASGSSHIVAAYDYRDEAGELLFQVCPLDPKDFRQRRPVEGGGWSWSVKGIRQVPYRLPSLVAADPATPAFIPEGEQDVDRLHSLGLVATCNAGGASKWKRCHAEHLHGRRIIILPDNDQAGRDHTTAVAKSLVGVATSVKFIELPGLPDKGDVSDWLDAGGTAAGLLDLAAAAPEWTPPASSTRAKTPAVEPALPLTDTGLAERFAKQHTATARYCWPWRHWLAWDGRRWNPDATGLVERLAKRIARSILHEAADEADDDMHKDLVKFARQSEGAMRRANMLRLAQSEEGIPIVPGDLDTDPWALNVINGTIDLRTGQLRPHRREDLLTKLAPVEFRADAEAPTWRRFLERILQGSASLIGFLQRLVGYCLTGDVSEHILPILYGTGANGKSTLVGTLLTMLGTDYAMKAPADLVMVKRNEQHPTALADLHGMRLVALVESGEGERLAESLVKELTGGDRIRARRMHQDFFEFAPTHKVLMATNHKPRVTGTDHAIWRRLRPVPFQVAIPDAEQDKHLPEKLRAELPGILTWCVQGCLNWQRDGLGAPSDVLAATGDYPDEEDAVGTFLVECCTLGTFEMVRAADLYGRYKRHCEANGEHALGQRRFGRAMNEKGFERFTNNGTWYRSIGLLAEP
jgi:putative DNA primase/helicase